MSVASTEAVELRQAGYIKVFLGPPASVYPGVEALWKAYNPSHPDNLHSMPPLDLEVAAFVEQTRQDWFSHLPAEWVSRPAAGAEERLSRVEQAWKSVVVTPSYKGVTKRMLPVFYAKKTLSALAVAAEAGPVLVLATSQTGAEEVRVFLERLAIPADRYQIWRVDGEDQLPAALARAEQQLSGQFHVYPVNPGRANWLKELLAGLEEQGNLPVGDLGPAVQAAQDYFQFV